MDILRKEINAFYARQELDRETLDQSLLRATNDAVALTATVVGDCRVVTDASADTCFIFGGEFASLLGISDSPECSVRFDSSDEDDIYNRIHPEDLVEKRMLEYEFFKFVDSLPAELKTAYKATCRLRITDRRGVYVTVANTSQITRLSPAGKIWLILCCYELSSERDATGGIDPCIINNATGEVRRISLSGRREQVLSPREKEILLLIRDGHLSKEIADILGISTHTVSRHRQNILQKLSVGNSLEAVKAAAAMKLL